MKRITATLLLICGLALAARAAEVKFDFGGTPVNQTPKGFKSLRLGEGAPGDWKIVLDDTPVAFPSFTVRTNQRPVLAQLATDKTDERFPVLLYDQEVFEDFTFTARFKVVGGVEEQMAGLVFRAQDEKNFYVLRANAKDGNVRFYTVINGKRTDPIGNNALVPTNTWHELKVECKGNRIQCQFNGNSIGQYFTDNTFRNGKVGFWTKSDSLSYFADAKVSYSPKEILARTIVRETKEKFPRVVGLRISAPSAGREELEIVASTNAKEIGQKGTKAEMDILARGTIYHEKGIDDVTIFMPLHDRNGDVVAVAHVILDTFMGQTEKNMVIRAMPIVKFMETRILTAKDLKE
jgi:hypothetical protein